MDHTGDGSSPADVDVDGLATVEDWERFFDGFKDHLAPLVHGTGRNLAYTEPDPRVHPEQTAWARQMRQGIYMPVESRVYVAVGYQLCSTTMVVGTDGVLIIDPGENDARTAHEAGDDGWAMELLTHLVRLDTTDTEARQAKADAMRAWAFRQKNMYWRTMAIGGAKELEGTVDYSKLFDIAPPDVIEQLPVTKVVEGLRVRLDADAAADTRLTLGFRFTDTGDACALEIRRGLAVFHPEPPPAADVTLVTTAALIHQLLLGTTTPADALRHGDITVEGDPATVHAFFDHFDKPPTEPVKMVLR